MLEVLVLSPQIKEQWTEQWLYPLLRMHALDNKTALSSAVPHCDSLMY